MISVGILAGGPAGGSAPYHADAVDFPYDDVTRNSTGISNASPLSIPDSATFSWSFWAWVDSDSNSNDPDFWNVETQPYCAAQGTSQISGPSMASGIYDTGDISLQAYNSESGGAADWEAQPNAMPVGVWIHIACSADSNHPAGEKIAQMFLNGVTAQPFSTVTDAGDAFTSKWSGQYFAIGGRQGGRYSLSDVQIWVNKFIDWSDPANLAKVISGGKPVDPVVAQTAFGQSDFLFSGDAATFADNQGSSGPFLTTAILFGAAGSNGPGPCTLTGAVLGASVLKVFGNGFFNSDITSDFEATISVANQIQQTGAPNYSASPVRVVFSGTLTNASTSPSD